MNAGSILLLLAGLAALNIAIWIAIMAVIRKRYPLPPEMAEADPDSRADEIFPGYYLETHILDNGAEAGRFRGWGLLARGNGGLYFTAKGLHFHRRGVKRALLIPTRALRAVNVVVSTRMRISGKLSCEVDWELAGRSLRSIFVIVGGVSYTRRAAKWIQNHLADVRVSLPPSLPTA